VGKNGKIVLNIIRKTTGIQWARKEIDIYFLKDSHSKSWVGGFSDPITIFIEKQGSTNKKKIIKNLSALKTVVIHELIHQNIYGIPLGDSENYIHKLKNRFKCDRICAIHIIVHAVLKEVFLKLKMEKELKADIKRCKNHKSYSCAWDIVEKIGYKKVVKEFKENLDL